MGEIIHAACSECGYGKQYKIGGGLMSINPEVVEKQLKGDDLDTWNMLREKDRIHFFAWKYEMAYCETCQKLQSIFIVDIRTKEGESMCLGSRCDSCRSILSKFEKDEEMICPACGKKTVSRMLTGRWD